VALIGRHAAVQRVDWVLAFLADRFATGSLSKTAFAFGSLPITPSRFFIAL
jgi:hypothetical protein